MITCAQPTHHRPARAAQWWLCLFFLLAILTTTSLAANFLGWDDASSPNAFNFAVDFPYGTNTYIYALGWGENNNATATLKAIPLSCTAGSTTLSTMEYDPAHPALQYIRISPPGVPAQQQLTCTFGQDVVSSSFVAVTAVVTTASLPTAETNISETLLWRKDGVVACDRTSWSTLKSAPSPSGGPSLDLFFSDQCNTSPPTTPTSLITWDTLLFDEISYNALDSTNATCAMLQISRTIPDGVTENVFVDYQTTLILDFTLPSPYISTYGFRTDADILLRAVWCTVGVRTALYPPDATSSINAFILNKNITTPTTKLINTLPTALPLSLGEFSLTPTQTTLDAGSFNTAHQDVPLRCTDEVTRFAFSPNTPLRLLPSDLLTISTSITSTFNMDWAAVHDYRCSSTNPALYCTPEHNAHTCTCSILQYAFLQTGGGGNLRYVDVDESTLIYMDFDNTNPTTPFIPYPISLSSIDPDHADGTMYTMLHTTRPPLEDTGLTPPETLNGLLPGQLRAAYGDLARCPDYVWSTQYNPRTGVGEVTAWFPLRDALAQTTRGFDTYELVLATANFTNKFNPQFFNQAPVHGIYRPGVNGVVDIDAHWQESKTQKQHYMLQLSVNVKLNQPYTVNTPDAMHLMVPLTVYTTVRPGVIPRSINQVTVLAWSRQHNDRTPTAINTYQPRPLFPPPHYRPLLSSTAIESDTWSVHFEQNGQAVLNVAPGSKVDVYFERVVSAGNLLNEDILSITPIECLTYTNCEALSAHTVKHHRNNFYDWRWEGESVVALQIPPVDVQVQQSSQQSAMEIKCTATVNNMPGQCNVKAQMKAPILSATQQHYLPLSPALESQSVDILPAGDAGYYCPAATGRYLPCDHELVRNNCGPNRCACTMELSPIVMCAFYNATQPTNSTLCAGQPSPDFGSPDVDYIEKCNACAKTPTQKDNWGYLCQHAPQLLDIALVQDMTVDVNGDVLDLSQPLVYTDQITLKINYTGSPHQVINIYVVLQDASGDVFAPALITSITPTAEINVNEALSTFMVTVSLKDTLLSAGATMVNFGAGLASSDARVWAHSSLGAQALAYVPGASNALTSQQPQEFAISSLSSSITLTLRPRGYARDGKKICQNGGTLVLGQCACSALFTGEFCEESTCNTFCDPIGTERVGDALQCNLTPPSTMPTCTCRAGYTGVKCDALASCDATLSPLDICPISSNKAFPFYNATTSECSCECSAQWKTNSPSSPCGACGLTCLNQGTHYNQCAQCTCPAVPSSTGRFYYGESCECGGLFITVRDSISSKKFLVIKDQHHIITQMVADSQNDGKDLLSLLQVGDFKAFVVSLLTGLVADHHKTLLANDPAAAKELLIWDETTQKRVLSSEMALQQVQLRKFDVEQKNYTDFSGAQAQEHVVVFDLMVLPSRKDCYGAKDSIDDRNWANTLNNLKTVANLLHAGEEYDPDEEDSQDPSVQNNDPQCLNMACQESKKKENNAAIGTFMPSGVVTFIALCAAAFVAVF